MAKDTNAVCKDDRVLWTAQDLAAYVGCSKSLVYQMAERGDIPSVKIGTLLRFDPEAVRAWVKNLSQRHGRRGEDNANE